MDWVIQKIAEKMSVRQKFWGIYKRTFQDCVIGWDIQLNIPDMSKEMHWDTLGPTKEILEYDMKLRENVRQREQLKQELAEPEKKPRGIFRAIVIIGIIILCIAAATA